MPDEVKDILFKAHPSIPRNLKISQTFFRAGFVEYWGSGIKRITDSCKEYGSPIPEIVNEAGGVAVKCKPSKTYLKAMNGEKTNNEISINKNIEGNENLTERQKKIIGLMNENNSITQAEIAKKLKITRQTVTVEIKYLKEMKIIDRLGSSRNGTWKVI